MMDRGFMHRTNKIEWVINGGSERYPHKLGVAL